MQDNLCGECLSLPKSHLSAYPGGERNCNLSVHTVGVKSRSHALCLSLSVSRWWTSSRWLLGKFHISSSQWSVVVRGTPAAPNLAVMDRWGRERGRGRDRLLELWWAGEDYYSLEYERRYGNIKICKSTGKGRSSGAVRNMIRLLPSSV